MTDNKKKIMITGHRPYDLTKDQITFAQQSLKKIMESLIKADKIDTCVSGGAVGPDTWWALLAQKNNLESELYLPFPNQDAKWSAKEKAVYNHIKKYASKVEYSSDSFNMAAYHIRNDQMLKIADAVIAVYDDTKTKSGTHSVVQKARKLGKQLIIIDINEMRVKKEKNEESN